MQKRIATPIAVAVHIQGESPVFGDSSTQVLVDDEAGGPFIVLRQCNSSTKPGEVRLDMDELELVIRVARRLMKAQPDIADDGYGGEF